MCREKKEEKKENEKGEKKSEGRISITYLPLKMLSAYQF